MNLIFEIRHKIMDRLPTEMLEQVLMRTFMVSYGHHLKSEKLSMSVAERITTHVYELLAGVCYNWWQTLHGWPESSTKHWLKHEIQRPVKNLYYRISREPKSLYMHWAGACLLDIAYLGDRVFALLPSNLILVYGPNNKLPLHELKLDRINAVLLEMCHKSKLMYVICYVTVSSQHDVRSTEFRPCQVTADGHIESWLPMFSLPDRVVAVSLKSNRLLATLQHELLVLTRTGVLLHSVSFPEWSLIRSIESKSGTFFVITPVSTELSPEQRARDLAVTKRRWTALADQLIDYHLEQQPVEPIQRMLESSRPVFRHSSMIAEVDRSGNVLHTYSSITDTVCEYEDERYMDLLLDPLGRIFVCTDRRLLLMSPELKLERVLVPFSSLDGHLRHDVMQHQLILLLRGGIIEVCSLS